MWRDSSPRLAGQTDKPPPPPPSPIFPTFFCVVLDGSCDTDTDLTYSHQRWTIGTHTILFFYCGMGSGRLYEFNINMVCFLSS